MEVRSSQLNNLSKHEPWLHKDSWKLHGKNCIPNFAEIFLNTPLHVICYIRYSSNYLSLITDMSLSPPDFEI